MNIKEIVKIEKIDNLGRGITYFNNKIMFVKNALIGEKVVVHNVSLKKKSYEAEVFEVLEESDIRVVPKCPYYDSCGGCNIMHMNYEEQLRFKIDKVKDIIKKYANLDINVKLIENDKTLFYRNKVSLKILDKEWGYYNNSTHNLASINNCLLAKNSINDIIKSHEFLNVNNGEITIRSNYKDEILISINSEEEVIIDENKIPENVVGIVVNDKVRYKIDYFFDNIDDKKFKVSYNSFFQVNNYMAGRIFNVLSGNLGGKNLLDLYCGVGTLGLSVVDNFDTVSGIEIVENAYKNALYNAKLNQKENASYYLGNVDNVLKDINLNFDTVIVDPPRKGLSTKTLSNIMEIQPDIIAYISCNPITLARDLNVLKQDYEIKKINVLDMFPNTFHVESIVIMNRKK